MEVLIGIPEAGVKLKPHIADDHLEYLELVFTPGDDRATVRTKKPLDADAVITVSYEISLSDVSHISSSSWSHRDSICIISLQSEKV